MGFAALYPSYEPNIENNPMHSNRALARVTKRTFDTSGKSAA
jgi:hypothetical protein